MDTSTNPLILHFDGKLIKELKVGKDLANYGLVLSNRVGRQTKDLGISPLSLLEVKELLDKFEISDNKNFN